MIQRRRLLQLAALPFSLGAGPPPRRTSMRVPAWTGADVAEDFDPKAFQVKVDGEPARILNQRGPADELMLVLVLDFTGDFERIELAKDAAVEAIRKLRAGVAVAILRAQDGMQVLVDPTADREVLEKAIRDLPVSGKAGFLDTVENACRIADGVLSKSRVRAAVVYLTDSSIYNHRADYANPVINSSDSHDMSRRFPEGLVKQKVASLEARLAGLQAPLFVVQLAYRTDRLEQAYQAGQLQLAAATGGSAQFCRSTAEVSQAVELAVTQASSLYVLELRLPEKTGRSVQLQVENGGYPWTYRSRFFLLP